MHINLLGFGGLRLGSPGRSHSLPGPCCRRFLSAAGAFPLRTRSVSQFMEICNPLLIEEKTFSRPARLLPAFAFLNASGKVEPVIINLARRAHDHNWELDPITRSLLDNDFYKLLMLQFIWKQFPKTNATFSFTNRPSEVRLADLIDIDELREQLEHTRKLRFHKSELIWLAGNTFYGHRGIFEPDFLEWLEHDFRLSDYELSKQDGQISLTFRGLWSQTTMWEIYAISAISELRTRANLKRLSEFELDILYSRAKTNLWQKMERLRGVPGLKLSDFGTRRRHSFLWQEYVVKAMRDVLGPTFTGTSNT